MNDSPPSKTRRKHEMHALQMLGERLTVLDPDRLDALELPDGLRDAIRLYLKTTKHEAKRRQMQYIGRLMRGVDPAPIEARLAEWSRAPLVERQLFARAEAWRDRMLADGGAATEFASTYGFEAPALVRLLERARAERAAGAPPRAYREVFRTIRAALGHDAAALAPDGPVGAQDALPDQPAENER